MLRELRIRDFAIIDDLTISFRQGLNVITGETGAGKSIILQALALLCGARATADLVRSRAEEAAIEGLFECALPAQATEALGLAAGEELLVRRHIARTGKGRIFVNGSPATVALLGQLGDHLVHLYGQHQQALLLQPGSHLDFLDSFGELGPLRRRMAAAHTALEEVRRHLEELERRSALAEERRDLLEFQQRELAAAAVEPDEEAGLRSEREKLRHAELLQDACRGGEATLYSSDGAVVGALAHLGSQLTALADVAPELGAPAELIETARVQLEEAALELRSAGERIRADPGRLEAVDERIALVGRLSRKYGVPAGELPGVLASKEHDLASLGAANADRAAATEAVQRCHRAAARVAAEVSAARKGAAGRLEKRMQGELAALGMSDARFQVRQEVPAGAGENPGATGIDTVEFLLSANRGEALKPLQRVASGGELSRIMLALKALTASASETPILIFDEVDAGIGSAVAEAVARRLKALAARRQILCITHLPQIAAYADHHFAVEKHRHSGRTVARARPLAPDERILELARMLGGNTAPAEAESYARRLIAQSRSAVGIS